MRSKGARVAGGTEQIRLSEAEMVAAAEQLKLSRATLYRLYWDRDGFAVWAKRLEEAGLGGTGESGQIISRRFWERPAGQTTFGAEGTHRLPAPRLLPAVCGAPGGDEAQ